MRIALISLLVSLPLVADDLGFREKFADPSTREAALGELIPATRDWYFYHALQQQLTGDWEAFGETMAEWEAVGRRKVRPVSTEGREILATRELLMRYEAGPEKNLAALIKRLELRFDDARPDAREVEKLADALDPREVSEPAFLEEASARMMRQTWAAFSDERLLTELKRVETLGEPEIRHLLQTLRRADYPGVVALVSRALAFQVPVSFGDAPLHAKLTLEQMDKLLELRPALRGSEAFTVQYLEKLRVHTDDEFARNPALHAAHLARCREFALTLPPALVSLRAHLLYHHLRLQREIGREPLGDFLAYLAIPRRMHAVLLTPERERGTDFPSLSKDYSKASGCGEIGDDRKFIESMLQHFLAGREDSEVFAPYVEKDALARIHARARLLAGADPAVWGGRIDPGEFADLLEQTRVDFAPGQPVLLDADAQVRLALDLKNTPELLVRIHELNLPALLDREGREPSAELDLDGLVPHHVRLLEFAQPPLVLHRETIELPELEGAGAWIVECVAKGHACRALIRKGRLIPYVERRSTGQVVRVFDEAARPVADAVLSFGPGSPPVAAGEDGVIFLPNTDVAMPSTGILTRGKLATPVEIGSREDAIRLDARFHLDREQLLADARANVRIQLRLANHGQELPLELLQAASLTLSARLVSDVTVEHVIADDLEIAPVMNVPFQVPADTLALTLRVSGTVVPRDGADPVTLSSDSSFLINSLLQGGFAHGYFTRTPAGHFLEIRGRNGEPLANRAVEFDFHREGFSDRISIAQRLRTNETGRVALGALEGIRYVRAVYDRNEIAVLDEDDLHPRNILPGTLRVGEGEEIQLPLGCPADREHLSFVEVDLAGRPRRDVFDRLTPAGAQLVIRGLSAGRYQLKMGGSSMRIEVEASDQRDGLFVSDRRIAPRVLAPMPVASRVSVEGSELQVRVAGATEHTRVHLVGSRYLHPWNSWYPLASFVRPESPVVEPGFVGCGYLTERKLDDEMRYILERRAARTFPGSMLPRPGLLVHRWSKEDVTAEEQQSGSGDAGRERSPRREGRRRSGGADPFASGEGGGWAAGSDFLDYLARSSELRYDLKPGADGIVRLPLATFDGCQVVQVVVTDEGSLCRRTLALPENPIPRRDRRLSQALDSEKRHIGTRRAAALAKGAEASIENILEADWRAFTTLAEAHEFLYGATRSEQLRDLSLLLDWPEFDEETKLAHWSEHACHELNLFLARKDPEFFKKHVRPLLAEKREPTFIDDLLLERDLSGYLRPFAWRRLNAAEKALLAQAVPSVRERIASEFNDRWELEAPSPERETRLFTQTLRGTDLATKDSLGMARAGILQDTGSSAGASYVLQKLRDMVIPVIDFEDLSVEEAIDYLRVRSLELDPDKQGVGFVVRYPAGRGDGGESGGLSGGDIGAQRIDRLFLRNVPMTEALNYICDLTRLRWTVGEYAVDIKPATETDEDLFTRKFKVPPDFVARISGGDDGIEVDDPFADPADRSRYTLARRMTVQEILEANGVKFPPEAVAQFFPESGTLLVKNTPANLDLVDQITSNLAMAAPGALGMDEGMVDAFADEVSVLPAIDSSPELPNSVGGGFAFRGRPSWRARPGQTRRWMESNYYRHLGDTDESFIPLNAFWRDLANWDGEGRFLSPHFNACTSNANEALLCLALLDLPFKAERPEVSVDGSSLLVKAREPMLLFYKDTRETDKVAPDGPVLVRQTLHRLDDRFRTEKGRKIENTLTGELRTGVAYGASLVVTNPSGTGRRIDVLAQIPAGAIPLSGQPATLSESRELAPYGVLSFDLAFYFPAPGDFAMYPMQVAEDDTILASASSRTLRVTADTPLEDRATWAGIARDGSNEEVLERLRSTNLHSVDLDLIRWRLRDREFFRKAVAILRDRLVPSQSVFSYGFHHGDVAAMKTWLENSVVRLECGEWLDSPLLRIRPVEHLGWQSLEFDPLVNPRAHKFGEYPRLSHPEALEHYEDFLGQLAWKPALSADDQLALVHHLLLQDRTGEAIDRFAKIDPETLGGRLMYDYLHAVVLFHQAKPGDARAIAERYADLPAGPWRERYAAVIAQADEIVAARKPREEPAKTPEIAARPLELALLPDGRLRVSGGDSVELKLYQVDLEMLFSKSPFLEDGGGLPGTRPNLVRSVQLQAGEAVVELPEEFRRGNVLVAADAGPSKVLEILDSRELEVTPRLADHVLTVTDAADGTPLPGCYVKVYAWENGHAVYHKDGYTDLRGRFDYLSLSDGEAVPSGRVAVFVSHEQKGARTMTPGH